VIDASKIGGQNVPWQEKYLGWLQIFAFLCLTHAGIVDTVGLVMYMLEFMKQSPGSDFEKESGLIASFDQSTVADLTSLPILAHSLFSLSFSTCILGSLCVP
jgi:hypothetical protein